MKKSKLKTIAILFCTATIATALTGCGKRNDNKSEPATENMSVTELSTELENTEDIVTADNCLSDGKGIVQPTKNPEKYFSEEVEITNYVEPDENGHYVVWESQWTLHVENKTLEEEIAARVDEIIKSDAEVIDTATASDESAKFIFDYDNYMKMGPVIENTTNSRSGLCGKCVSISKDFREVIMYIDKNKKLSDFYLDLSLLSWTMFECQAYSGVAADDQKLLVKVANIDTEEVLTNFTLSVGLDFSLSEDDWNALFD